MSPNPANSRRRRWLKYLLFTGIWALTALALFYGIENWRGHRAWASARQELESNGARLRLADLIPAPVADDQNFAAQPLITNWFKPDQATEQTEQFRFDQIESRIDSKRKADGPHTVTDLVAWAKAFAGQQEVQPTPFDQLTREAQAEAAAQVLAGLKPFTVELDQIIRRLDLPHSRYPIHYDLENPWMIPLPHLVQIRGACNRLQLRASAYLAAGQSGSALEDIQDGVKLAETLRNEPMLISQLVRVAALKALLQPVWGGLQARRWSAEELAALAGAFARVDVLPGLCRAMEMERACGVQLVEYVQHGKDVAILLEHGGGSYPPGVGLLARVLPAGWYDLEKVRFCRFMDAHFWDHVDLTNRQFHAGQMSAASQEFAKGLGSPLGALWRHELIAQLLLPATSRAAQRFAQAQTYADHVSLACALERHRLTEQTYPPTLEALVPSQLPVLPEDLVTNKGYVYRPQTNSFLLYSVGWDQIDHGGKPQPKEGSGDWVWGYLLP